MVGRDTLDWLVDILRVVFYITATVALWFAIAVLGGIAVTVT